MKPCPEFEALILDRAAGELLAPADGAALDQHLVGCPGCRAEDRGAREALSLVTLPAPSPEEHAALDAALAQHLPAAWRKAEARRSFRRGAWAGLAAAAAAVALYLVMPRAPAHSATEFPPLPPGAAAEVETWALGDPLAETVEAATTPAAPEPTEALDPQTYADLYLNPGE